MTIWEEKTMVKFEIANVYVGPDAPLYYGKYLNDKTKPDYRIVASAGTTLDIFILPYVNSDVLLAYKSERNKKGPFGGLYRVVILKEKKKI